MANKIYRKVIRYEILSEYPIDTTDLTEIDEQTTGGDWSGRFLDDEVESEQLEGKEAVEAIKAQGSDPEFFGMDDEGNDIGLT